MDPFDILGVAPNATVDMCKQAYRRLAAKHHPDRAGGDKHAFQAIQSAWDQIQGGYRRVARPVPDSTDPVYSSFFTSRNPPKKKTSSSDGYQSAFFGGDPSRTYQNSKGARFSDVADDFKRATEPRHSYTTITIPYINEDYTFAGAEFEYTIKAGTPHGWTGPIMGHRSMVGNTGHNTIYVKVMLTNIDDPTMIVQGLDVENGRVPYAQNIGDMSCVVRTNALNLIMGAWISVRDVFGKPHTVRLPEGFNPEQRLRIAGAGYFLWDNVKKKPILEERGDLIVEVIPEFTAWSKMSEDDRANAVKVMK